MVLTESFTFLTSQYRYRNFFAFHKSSTDALSGAVQVPAVYWHDPDGPPFVICYCTTSLAYPWTVCSTRDPTIGFPGLDLTSCTNLRWSKLLVNSIPTGVTGDSVAHTPAVIHDQLLKENPAYCRLWITQLPTWVQCPDLYGPGSSLSVTFTFEDLDGSLLTSLLSSHFLFLFGVQSTLRKWINRCTTLAKLNTAKHKKGLLKLQTEQDKFFTQKDKEDKIATDSGLARPVTPVVKSLVT